MFIRYSLKDSPLPECFFLLKATLMHTLAIGQINLPACVINVFSTSPENMKKGYTKYFLKIFEQLLLLTFSNEHIIQAEEC